MRIISNVELLAVGGGQVECNYPGSPTNQCGPYPTPTPTPAPTPTPTPAPTPTPTGICPPNAPPTCYL